MKEWKTISSKLIVNHERFKLRQDEVKLPTGKVIDDYFFSQIPDGALVVALTSKNEIVLVSQYKHANSMITLEAPAGGLDVNEDPEKGALRELIEETGYTSQKITFLAKLTNLPTSVKGDLYVYLMEDVEHTGEMHFDENEDIEVVVRPYKEVVEMIMKGEINVTGTIAGIFLALKKLNLPI